MSTTTRSVLVRLRAEMAQFKREWKDGTGAVKETREELGRASKQAKQAGRDLEATGSSVGKASKNLRDHRKAWDDVGTSLLRTGAVVTAAGALMAKAAIDWETAWAGVTKTVSGTPEQLAAVETGLRDLAKSMPESHTQIAAVAEAAGQLGVKTEDIVDFTRNMVMLGDTTNLSADEAATSIAQLMNVMQTAPDDVDRLSSTLVALGNSGASTERDIIQMAQRIAGAGEIVGLSEANVLSLANALASSGIEVEAGGSAISSVLIDISKAVDTGSSKLDTFAKVAGTTAQDFGAKWKADPASALADFTEGLGRMSANGENVFGTLEELGQSDVRVTRALLNMANAGSLLRDSLADGDAAWERNNALVKEAEKRYDTTAAQIEIAWNNIKDNAIDAGQAMLPALSAVSDVVVTIADAFGALPDPVKAGMGSLLLIGGAAALAVGGLMKAAGAASDFRSSLNDLEVSSPRAGRALRFLAKGFAAVTAAAVAGDILESWDEIDVDGVNQFAKGLLQAADGSDKLLNNLTSADSTGLFGWNANSVDGIADAFDKAAEGKGKLDLSFAHESDWERAGKFVEQIDAALSSMVASGDVERAGDSFEYLQKKTGKSTDELLKLLPGYKDAMAGVDNEQEKAAKSAQKLADGNGALATRLSELGPNADDARQVLDDLQQSTEDAALGFIDLAKELDTSKTSFDDWLKDIEDQRKAMNDWGDNLVKAAKRGVSDGVIKEFEKMGPEGAKRLGELVDASDKEIDRLNEAFDGAGADAEQLADILNALPQGVITEFSAPGAKDSVDIAVMVAEKYGLVPDQVRSVLEALDYTDKDIAAVLRKLGIVNDTSAHPKIRIDDGNAFSIINGIQTSINRMTGKTVYVKVKKQGGTPGGILPESADGGAIIGEGGPRDDSILGWLSNGEHVWTAAEVAAVGGQGAMYAMRAAIRGGARPQFASGGSTSDAWNQSYRAAAATYGSPVASLPAAGPSYADVSPSVLSVDVTGTRVGYDKDLRPILQGEIQVAIAGQQNYSAGNRRAGRKP